MTYVQSASAGYRNPVVVEKRAPRRVSSAAPVLSIKSETLIDNGVVEEPLIDISKVRRLDSQYANAVRNPALSFLRAGDITITGEQAAYLTEHCVHPEQSAIRPLDHESAIKHIAVLRSIMMTDGAWLDETQLRFGVLDGRVWGMDGNHRIRSQATAGVDIRWNVKIDHYSDESEFRAAFHKFNTNSRGRTQAQIVNAAGLARELGISRQVATAVYDAMPVIQLGFRTGKARTEDEILRSRVVETRLAYCGKFGDEAALYDACLRGGDGAVKRKLLTAGTTAVALVTLKYCAEAAQEFWSGVAQNDGLKKGDPRHTLVMDMMTRTLSKGAAHQSFAAPAAAWNAWHAGRSLSIVKVLDQDAVRIAGTPYKG